MRVAIVTRHLGLPVGFGTYAANLLRALDGLEGDDEFVVHCPEWNDVPELGPRFSVQRYGVRRSRSLLNAWDLRVGRRAAHGADVVHYLHPGYPARKPRVPIIVNLLDAIGWVVPGYRLPFPFDRLERRAARHADLVLTLSESARSDIARVLGVPGSRIRVTYLGAPPVEPDSHRVRDGFLFVGGTEKRKNLGLVLQALDGLDGARVKVVGPALESPVHDPPAEHPRVEWLGHVSDDELAELYRTSLALVFPTRYEGFGLPVVEAMARRAAVITTQSSSLPEITRGAAVVVNPDDHIELREAMRRIGADDWFRRELVERGAKVAAQFTWEKTAKETLAAYRELA